MDSLTIGPGPTEVLIGRGLPDVLLPKRDDRSKVAVLTHPGATDIALKLTRILEADGLVAEVVGLPDRDAAKTLDVASSVYDVLARFRLNRGDTVLGVGGGSVTDLSGFVAGTWMRGVESVLVPTTMLGAVDAAIGGKTGVNLSGKNLVGVFWHPTRVLIDTAQLESLPLSLIREGFSEAFKAGLVGDVDLVEIVRRGGLGSPFSEVVRRAIQVKAEIVEQDAAETGVRAYLNFGHTIGHALEYASTLSHGEAVALGMIAAGAVSKAKLGFAHSAELVATIDLLGLPTSITGIHRSRVIELLGNDKKRDWTGLRMVLLRDYADPTIKTVTVEEVSEGLAAIGL